MPTITYEGPKLSVDKKRDAAKEITEIISKATHVGPAEITVVFRENSPENVAVGGVLIADRKKASVDQ